MKPENLSIILVEPQGPINIGSICRSMMNFGFSSLRLVNPCREYLSLDAKKMAMGAFKILEKAELFDDLASALHDIHTAFGTTRRFGKYRKNFLTPSTAGERTNEMDDQTKAALVMGTEDSGLSTKDLELCQHFITIPTHDDYPSMNLSHSLTVLLYEISLKSDAGEKFYDPVPEKPAPGNEIQHMFAHMRQTLLDIDFLDSQNPDHLLRTFRRLFGSAGLSSRDVRIIQGLMSRIDWTEDQRRKTAPKN
ncbi:MAG: RNA methyltransferase [Desulfobacteraceae bacterium 4572_89]|nr:MAG: RNA methyltransferase [Desulfobacteraceae bacterium 4572_89]